MAEDGDTGAEPLRRRVERDPGRTRPPAGEDLPTVRISTTDQDPAETPEDDHPTRRTLPGERFGAVPVVRVGSPSPEPIDTAHPGHARLVGNEEHQTQEGGAMTDHESDTPSEDEVGPSDLGLGSAAGTDFGSGDEEFLLPHWTEPPTGQVPKAVAADDQADEPTTGSQPRWRDERERSGEADFEDLRDEGPGLGALAGPPAETTTDDDFFSGESDEDPFAAFAPADDESSTVRVSRRRREEPAEPAPSRGLAGFGRRGRRRPEDAAGATGGGAGGIEEEVDVVDFDDTGDVVELDDTFSTRGGADEFGGGGGGDGGEPPTRSGGEPPVRSGGDRDLVTAIAVGLGLVALALICFRLGGLPTTILACLVVGLAAAEYFNVARSLLDGGDGRAGAGADRDPFFPTIVGLVGIVGLLVATYTSGLAAYPVVIPIVVVATLVWYLWVPDRTERNVLLKIGLVLLGFVWIGVLGSFATLFLGLGRQMQEADPGLTSNPGIGVLIAAIVATVASDVGGYFVGRSFGQTPLSAASPNKTLEGMIGGFIASVVAVVVIVGIVGIAPIGGSFPRVFVFALLCALAAPLGDLVESMIKRDVGVKDMGGVLPGHGGVLDRFDGLLVVLPVAYFVTLLFGVWSTG